MIGKRFGRLVVTELNSRDRKYNKRWDCICDCGNTKVVLGDKLKTGNTKSCGCYQAEFVAELQKGRKVYTRKSYAAMLARCHDPKAPAYHKYGAVGISVCDRWRFGDGEKSGWDCFYSDMGPRQQGLSIDRIDNERGYEPDNCRWATQEQQLANRRRVGRKPVIETPPVKGTQLTPLCQPTI